MAGKQHVSERAYVRDIFAQAPWFGSSSPGWHRQCLKSSRKVYSGCTSPQVCVTTFNAAYPSQAKHRGPPWNLSHEFPFMHFHMFLSFLLILDDFLNCFSGLRGKISLIGLIVQIALR